MNNHKIQDSGVELLQGDLAINFFMVLISILATLTIAGAVVSSTGFKIKVFKENDNNKPLGLSNGWNPIQQVRQRLVVRNKIITLIDLTPVAESFAKGNPFFPEIPGFDQTMLNRKDNDPSAFFLTLFIGDDPLPQEISVWQVASSTVKRKNFILNDKIKNYFEKFDNFDILLYPESEEAGWDLAYFLHKLNKNYEILFQKKGRLGFQRNSALYTFESIYK